MTCLRRQDILAVFRETIRYRKSHDNTEFVHCHVDDLKIFEQLGYINELMTRAVITLEGTLLKPVAPHKERINRFLNLKTDINEEYDARVRALYGESWLSIDTD
jgi:hypothetical protein